MPEEPGQVGTNEVPDPSGVNAPTDTVPEEPGQVGSNEVPSPSGVNTPTKVNGDSPPGVQEITPARSQSSSVPETPVSAEDVRPFGVRQGRKESAPKRKKGKSQIFTDTPVKRQIEMEASSVKSRKKIFNQEAAQKMTKKQKQKQNKDSSKGKSKSKAKEDPAPVMEDWLCLFCNELYSASTPGEEWIRCSLCLDWAHAACADTDQTHHFICEFCR